MAYTWEQISHLINTASQNGLLKRMAEADCYLQPVQVEGGWKLGLVNEEKMRRNGTGSPDGEIDEQPFVSLYAELCRIAFTARLAGSLPDGVTDTHGELSSDIAVGMQSEIAPSVRVSGVEPGGRHQEFGALTRR